MPQEHLRDTTPKAGNTNEFPALKRRKIAANFGGGAITGDGGVMILRQIDRPFGLLQSIDTAIPVPRDPRYIQDSQLRLLCQRIFGLGLGYAELITMVRCELIRRYKVRWIVTVN